MEEHLDFVFEEKRRGGVSLAVALSLVLHAVFIVYVVATYRPVTQADAATPMVRYVELIRQNKQFTEAPGPKTDTAPITAPYSNANRKASTPQPTGDKPTLRPGNGGMYTPPAPVPVPAAHEEPAQRPEAPTFSYRPQQSNAGAVDWRNAIKEVGKIASLGTGQQSIDLGNAGGGEKGFAESGPVSFESQWYDWGEYASSMVS